MGGMIIQSLVIYPTIVQLDYVAIIIVHNLMLLLLCD